MADDVEDIKELMQKGFDQAFVAAISNLFMVYSANQASVEGQEERTKKGIENAIEAYRLAVAAVEAWEG